MADTHSNSPWPDITVRLAGGVPTIHRDGALWFGLGANRPSDGNHFEVFERLAAQGIRQFHVDATCSEDIYHPELRFWHGPGRFDGAAQDRQFQRLAAICPEALFQLRVYVGAPPWWIEQHPDHCQVFADGHVDHEIQRGGKRRLPSLASPVWRRDACAGLERYLRWLVESGWSRRVSGLFLCYGITWEWGLLGSDDFLDYSAHGQHYFRQWLRRRYGDASQLAAAWGRAVDFESARIPAAERRARPAGPSGLRTVPEEQDVIDHQQSLSDMNADMLLALADTAKHASGGRALVGAAYGYTLTAREHSAFMGRYGAGGFQGGHHALGRVLRSPSVDWLVSPFNYANRSLGTGLLLEHIPLASVHAHGKAFFDENDLWAWNNPPHFEATTLSVGYTHTREQTVLAYRLAFLQAIVRGKHQWLTELTGWIGPFAENFSDPVLLAEIRHLQGRADSLLCMDRSPVTEVAFVLDESSVAHLGLDHTGFRDKVYRASVRWGHLGTPFDLILLDDLLAAPSCRYKLVVPTCVKSADAIARLQAWTGANPGVTVVWDGQPAWYPPEDVAALIAHGTEAGVHRYLEDDSTVWANASMIGVHVHAAGRRTVRFRGPVRGTEFFSGKRFTADSAGLSWDFAEHDVALFVIGNV